MRVFYTRTKVSCYMGYVTQAIINSFPPLLFIMIQREFGATLDQLALLISLNFGIQLVMDLICTRLVDKIGYRAAAVFAHICACVGVAGLGLLPGLLAQPFHGFVLAICVSAVGGGIIEVITNPIVEAIPGDAKAATMSLLHSFYCWGCVAVIGLSTVFFSTVGQANWRILALMWALVPLANVLLFSGAPLENLVGAHDRTPLKKMFSKRIFLLFLLFMLCAGAAEQAMSQWASLFAEVGLGISKTMGDLLGPMAFALFMGTSRLVYGLKGGGWKLENALLASGVLCLGSYLLTVFSPFPLLSLVGCSVCGFSVGLLWPGTFSLTARRFPAGGAAMSAVLALAGDLGCATGPGLVGVVSGAAENGAFQTIQGWFSASSAEGSGLKTGLLFATIFSVVLIAGLLGLRRAHKAS